MITFGDERIEGNRFHKLLCKFVLFGSFTIKITLVTKITLKLNHQRMNMIYSPVPHDISVKNRPHIKWWFHKIKIELKNSYCLLLS